MSNIRKQSIISSIVVYFGFALGFFNTYLFTKQGGFTKEEYGLTGVFIAIANIMYSVANLGMPSFINKFFPYYKSRLSKRENDMLSWALLITTLGFGVVTLFGLSFKNFFLERFANSPQLPQYYYWLFPFGFGLALFGVLEAYAWQLQKSILTNFLREVFLRLLQTVLIGLTLAGVIYSFSVFIRLYAFIYLAAAAVLLLYILTKGNTGIAIKASIVSKKFFNKIITLCSFVWTGSLVLNISSVFDTIVLAAVMPNGLAFAGIFTLAQNISSLIQAPQRGIIGASFGPLSQAWKDKDYERIKKIYHHSSINQLLFSTAMFSLIWLNFEDGVITFGLQKDYLAAKDVFLLIGLTRIIDMGTGVNAQIIGTSTFWRFEFVSGLILLALALPLNYTLTRNYGVIGPAMSNLLAFTVYNAVRFFFLYKKFNMQPFDRNTIFTLLLAAACYAITYALCHTNLGLTWIVIRSTLFLTLFATATVALNLSPDLKPVINTVKKRLKL